jgi:hypothetical protein
MEETPYSVLMSRLDPATIELLIETLANAFWYKRGLLDFFRRHGVASVDLAEAESQGAKYKIVRWLVGRYECSDRGHELLRGFADGICAKATFTDLTPEQQLVTQNRQELLRQLLSGRGGKRSIPGCDPLVALRPSDLLAAQTMRSFADLRRELESLVQQIGTAPAGVAFEQWLIRLAIASGLDARGRYIANGREFDGSICVDSDVYLLEAKFRLDKADAPDISNLRDKVAGHADGALGVFIAMSGFTSNAVATASRAGTPLILLHGQHLFTALSGTVTLADLVRRTRRHSLETGCPLLA